MGTTLSITELGNLISGLKSQGITIEGVSDTPMTSPPVATEVMPLGPPTEESIKKALTDSYNADVNLAKERHGKPAGCTLCIPCAILFRKGSQGPQRDKHKAHQLYVFADET